MSTCYNACLGSCANVEECCTLKNVDIARRGQGDLQTVAVDTTPDLPLSHQQLGAYYISRLSFSFFTLPTSIVSLEQYINSLLESQLTRN